MTGGGLSARELTQVTEVLGRYPEIREAILFGSRALGRHRPESDVDLALVGVGDGLVAEAVADALEDLPMPYRFDVKAFDTLLYPPLRDHIERVGQVIYRRRAAFP